MLAAQDPEIALAFYTMAPTGAEDLKQKGLIWKRTCALSYAAHNPAYVIGKRVIAQVCHGVCQTGDGITTWQDLFALVYDNTMRHGVMDSAGIVTKLDE